MTCAPIDTCFHCGEPEAAHHEFEAVTRPAGVSVRRRHVARRPHTVCVREVRAGAERLPAPV